MSEKFLGKYRIGSTRMLGYDYSSAGTYFVTICTKNKNPYFGKIARDGMHLNDVGWMVNQYWSEVTNHFFNVILDEYIIMPDHVHGIIHIVTNKNNTLTCKNVSLPRANVGPSCTNVAPSCRNVAMQRFYRGAYPEMSKISPKPASLPTIIRSFKSICTREINKKYTHNYFRWQPEYWDRIIRFENELNNVRNYIRMNPKMWWTKNNYQ